MPVSTKKVSRKKKSPGRPRNEELAKKKRIWMRFDDQTLEQIERIKTEMLKQIPMLFHGHVDDSCVISALVHKVHCDLVRGDFAPGDYLLDRETPVP